MGWVKGLAVGATVTKLAVRDDRGRGLGGHVGGGVFVAGELGRGVGYRGAAYLARQCRWSR